MAKNIKFVNVNQVHEEYYPRPAKDMIPSWYKESLSYIGGKKKYLAAYKSVNKSDDGTAATVKKCMPLLDAITAGYILVTHEDILIESQGDQPPYFYWTSKTSPSITFQPIAQAENYPNIPKWDIPKWVNNWAITTPAGYSCLFVAPMHRESPIKIFEGVVDTDSYTAKIEFPFMLKDPKWEGIIPAGTPIVQVIPFKRDSFTMQVSNSKEDLEAIERVNKRLKSMFLNSYKVKFWSKKEYK